MYGNFEINKSTPSTQKYGQHGENGAAVNYKNKNIKDTWIIRNEVSDMISVNRTIPDVRKKQCRYWHYPTHLPGVSIIITFYNEHLSVLLRSLFAIWNRTPAHLMHEIILIDDNSDLDTLKSELEQRLKPFRSKVRLLRNTEYQGFQGSRVIGSNAATGDILVFLTAHCEVSNNWLPPLITQIIKSRNAVVVPLVNAINSATFEYVHLDDNFIGLFNWSMKYVETKIPTHTANSKKHVTEPHATPTFDGAYFAINREFFIELGGFDIDQPYQIEEVLHLSFKYWQCGAKIMIVPCSVVGHVFSEYLPVPTDTAKLDTQLTNAYYTKYIIETWVESEEIKQYFYNTYPLLKMVTPPNNYLQLQLKSRLQCKSFKWYLEKVAYEVLNNSPVPSEVLYWGNLYNLGRNKCIRVNERAETLTRADKCNDMTQNMVFSLNRDGRLMVGTGCVDVFSSREGNTRVLIMPCAAHSANGPWRMNPEVNYIEHRSHHRCLAFDPLDNKVTLQICRPADTFLIWEFREIEL